VTAEARRPSKWRVRVILQIMRFFVHSGEAVQELVERYDSAASALEAVSMLTQKLPNVQVFSENGEQVSPAELQQLAAEENDSDDA
jgi:hypothetical protein